VTLGQNPPSSVLTADIMTQHQLLTHLLSRLRC